MAKKKRSLWEEMQDETLKRLAGYETTVNKRLQKYYKTEAQRLTDEIAAFYQKYGQNNVISYNTVMQALPPGDQDLLRQSINDFVAKYPQYARLAPVAENIYKLNRLEGLQASLRMHELNDGVFESQTIEKHLKQVGTDAYRETAQVTMAQYNPEIVKRFVNNLSTTNVTDTVMNNKSKLARYLVEDISRGIARGDSYARLSKQIAERYQRVSRNDAARLIYTQGTLVHNEATAGVVENDFDQYQISTVGDAKVCEICRGFEGKIFEFKDRKVGENFPPFHPWCRCSFTIYVEDREQWLRDHTAGGGVSEAAEQELEAVTPPETKEPEWKYKKTTLAEARKAASVFDNLVENAYRIDEAEQLLNTKDRHLAGAAADAIWNYTGDWYNDIRFPETDKKVEQEAKAMRTLIDYTIDKMPQNKQPIFRGINFADEDEGFTDKWVEQLLAKGVWKEPGPASFSTEESRAKVFATPMRHKSKGGVILKIEKPTRGAYIRELSQYAYEREVLTTSESGARGWKVTNAEKIGNIWYVDGEEY